MTIFGSKGSHAGSHQVQILACLIVSQLLQGGETHGCYHLDHLLQENKTEINSASACFIFKYMLMFLELAVK